MPDRAMNIASTTYCVAALPHRLRPVHTPTRNQRADDLSSIGALVANLFGSIEEQRSFEPRHPMCAALLGETFQQRAVLPDSIPQEVSMVDIRRTSIAACPLRTTLYGVH